MKYEHKIDLNNENTTFYKILQMISESSTVLEVGCATGYLTQILKEKYNCTVYCIEIDNNAAKLAEKFCEKMFIEDVESFNFNKNFNDIKFDTIILADILEHLKKPEILLEKLKNILKPEGSLIISIPNIVHASVVLNALEGKWEYNPIGLLDHTHLRFFTKQSFLNLLEEKGYLPLKIDRVIINPWDTEFKTPYTKFPKEITNYIEKSNPDFNTYQFVIKAIPFSKDTKIIVLEDENKQLKETVLDLKNKINEITDRNNTLINEIHSLNIANQNHINEINKLTKRLNEQHLINQHNLQKLSELNDKIFHLQNEISEKNYEITLIKDSLFWKFASAYRKIINWSMPEGSGRRKFYNLFNNALKTLFSQGYEATLNKSIKYIKKTKSNTEKIDYPKFITNWYSLTFPKYNSPLVSIIIPAYNKAIYTFNCLKSILDNTTVSYEVIVIDDNSNDETEKMLTSFEDIKYIRNKENLGFIESCNFGAERSCGKYLIFLNNDTMVTPNWCKNLIDVYEKFDDVGIVGAKLIYPDGKLQEAGSIIFNDGSGWNYGKFDTPTKPEYNFIRKVDYCSGACIAIKKELFFKVGKFDTLFKPAYYEDTDLAMKIREENLNVYYQPFCEIIHFEGITSGTDTSSGIKKYQEINKEKFYDKWQSILSEKHKEPGTNLFLSRERIGKGIILVVDHYVPSYDKDSGSLRMFSILKILVNHGWKVIFWPDNLAKMEPYTSTLQSLGIETIYGNQSFIKFIEEKGSFIDYALLSRPHIAKNFIDQIKKYSNAEILYDTVDLHYVREERRAKVENDPKVLKEARKWKDIEMYLCSKSDIVVAITDIEKTTLEKDVPNKKIVVIPNIHTPYDKIKSFEDRKDIMFIGSFLHPPNIDAVNWFVNEIFPVILEKIPEVKFYIIGSEPTNEVKQLASDNVIVTGFVEDVSPYFEQSKVFVSPLRYGAGLKGKIGQSMSFGLPIVTTTIGAEGFIVEETPFIISDEPEEFAKNVVKLYNNKSVWEKLSNAGINTIKKHYSPESVAVTLNNIFK